MDKKKLLLFVLIMVLSLSMMLFACNTENGNADTPDAPDEEETDDVPVPPPVIDMTVWGDWEVVTIPAMDKVGQIKRKSVDGEKEKVIDIPALNSPLYSRRVEQEPTCVETGKYIYTLVVGGQDVTFEITIGALGHDWNSVTYEWSEDGKTCTAIRVCKRDNTHMDKATGVITSAVEIVPTCMAMGTTKYTATFSEEWAQSETAVTKSVVDIPVDPDAHEWLDTTYTWSADGKTYTATRACKHNASHTETSTSTEIIATLNTAPTYANVGKVDYKVTFDKDWAGTETFTREDLPMLSAEGYTLIATKTESTAYVMGVATYTYTVPSGTTLTFDSEKEVRDLKYFGKTSYFDSIRQAELHAGHFQQDNIDEYINSCKEKAQIVDIKGYKALMASYGTKFVDNSYNKAFSEIMSDMDKRGIDVQFSVMVNTNSEGIVSIMPMILDGLCCSNDVDALLSAFKANSIFSDASFIKVNDDFIILNDEDNTYVGYDVIEQSTVLENGLKVSKDGKVLIVAPVVDGAPSVDVTIPEGVEIVASCAFNDLTNYNVTLADSVKYISDSAFCMTNSVIIHDTSLLEHVGVEGLSQTNIIGDISKLAHLSEIGIRAFSSSTLSNVLLSDAIVCGDNAFVAATIDTFDASAYTGSNSHNIIERASIKNFKGSTAMLDVANRNALETAVITAGESLANGYFANAAALTYVRLADTITSIEANAFAGTTIIYFDAQNLPAGLDPSWKADTNKVYVYSEVEPSIDPLAGIDGYWHYVNSVPTVWEYTAKYTASAIDENAYQIVKYIGTDAVVTLPDEYMGKPITVVGKNAFDGNTNVTSVTLGANIETLNEFAFANCTNLSSVTLNSGLKKMCIGAFNSCEALTDITLPEGLLEIYEGVFSYSGLKTLNIPSTVRDIRNHPLGANTVTTLTVASGNTRYTSRIDGVESNVIIDTENGVLVEVLARDTFDMPSNVHGLIGAGLQVKINTLNISNDFTIKHGQVSSLKADTVNITGGTLTLEESAFIYSGIKNINISATISSIPQHTFECMGQLVNIVLPDSVTAIDDTAFNDTSANIFISTITVPSGAWITGTNKVYAYSETGIVNNYNNDIAGYWHYVDSVPTVWDTVFGVNEELGTSLMYALSEVHSTATEIVVPDTFDGAPIVSVGDDAFAAAPNMKKLTLGTNIDTIASGVMSAFALTDVKIANKDVVLEKEALVGSAATIVNYCGPTNVYHYMYNNGMKKYAESTLQTLEIYGTSGERGSVLYINDISTLVTFKCTNCANLLQINNENLETLCIDSVVVIDAYTFGPCPNLKELYVPFTKDYFALRDGKFVKFVEDSHVVAHYGYNNEVTDDGLYGYRLENGILYLLEYLGSNTEAVVPECIGEKKIDEYYAFAGNDKITKMSFADSMTYVPNNMATNMSSLNTIDITNIKNIGNSAFIGCSALVNVNFTGGVNIGAYAFKGTGLQELVLDEAIGTIGKSAFANCTALSSVTIGSNVTALPDSVFYNCSSLTSIVIPENVKSIGQSAFANTGLTSIILPETIDSIGDGAFDSLNTGETPTFIVMPSTMTTMPNVNIFNGVNVGGLCFRANVTDEMLAAAVSQIAPKYLYAESNPIITADFAGTWSYDEAHNIVINDNEYYTVEKYFDSSSEYNKDAYKIIGYINPAATYDLVIPDTYRGVKIRTIHENVFKGDTKLRSVVINNKLIGTSAFQNCTNLNSVTLAIDNIGIGKNAFSGCQALTSIYIPKLTQIGEYAFDGCSLETITFEEVDTSTGAFMDKVSAYAFRGAKITELTLVEGEYRDYAFDSCMNLTKVTMPYEGQISIIGSQVFNNCPLFKTIEGSTTLLRINNDLDVANINIGTFSSVYGGARVKHIAIGPNVGITEDTFGSVGATPESVTIAPEHTDVEIDGDGNIIWTNSDGKKVLLLARTNTIPTDINIIGARAFAYTSYTSVEIPRNVNRIEAYAFASSGLTSMTIPRNIQYVGLCAFADCASLSTITVRVSEASVKTWHIEWNQGYTGSVNIDSSMRSGDYTYDLDIDDNARLLEYHGDFNAGTADAGKVVIPDEIDGYKVIGIGAIFKNKTGLKSLVLNQYITELPEFFCLNCNTLTSVDLKNVQRINGNAFSRTGLTSIDLKNVTYVDTKAFYYTYISGEIVIPATMTEIGNQAFASIDANYTVRFEVDSNTHKSALKTIGASAFRDIVQKDIVLPEGLEVVKHNAFRSSIGNDLSDSVSCVENITLPSTLVDFYPQTLYSGGIHKFTVHPDNKYYKTIDNGNALVYIGDETRTYQDFDQENQLLKCSISKNYILNTTKFFTTIPDDGSIVGIGPSAFEYTALSQITVPATIVEIGTLAFSSASLTKVEVLGSGLKTICASAFHLMGATGPAEIILPEGIINMGESINMNTNTTIRVRGPEPAVLPSTWSEAWYYSPDALEYAAKVEWNYVG